jgi:ABC-type transport system substrate-binding protein
MARPEFEALPADSRARTVRAMLATAGFPDGVRSNLMVWNAEPAPGLARAIAPMARAAGIDLDVEVTDSGSAQKRLVSGFFDLALRPFASGLYPTSYGAFLSGAPENYWGIADPALDDLIRAQAIEGDVTTRHEQQRALQRRLLDQAWLMPLTDTSSYTVWQAGVRNFRNHGRAAQPYPLTGVSETIWKQAPAGR